MATTDAGLSIINSALIRLGATPIASTADLSGQGVTAQALFRQISTSLVSDHFWSFSLRDSALNQLYAFQYSNNNVYNTPIPPQTNPVPRNYSAQYCYQLPADLLRVAGLRSFYPWELAGDQLFTCDSAAVLVYIADIDSSAWPPWFKELVILRLASQMAIAVTDHTERATYFQNEFDKYWRRARAIDSQQAIPISYDLERIFLVPSFNPLAGA